MEAIARRAAADRLQIERPVAFCRSCGAALYIEDRRAPMECEEAGCPADDQLDAA